MLARHWQVLSGYRERTSWEEAAAEAFRKFISTHQKYLDSVASIQVEAYRKQQTQQEAEMKRLLGAEVAGTSTQFELGPSTLPAKSVATSVEAEVEIAQWTFRA